MRPTVLKRAIMVAVAAIAVIFASSRVVTVEADHGPPRIPGYDISWPQCGNPWPQGPVAFAIIGLTGGKPYTANPCFLEQYRWAQSAERHPAVYINVDYPKPGRVEAKTGPYGTCTEEDLWCQAYNYGYGIGRDVTNRAAAFRITPSMWWLDIETGNYWSDDPVYNAQVIRGTIDFFSERRLPAGIYGTPRQWRIIAGEYAPGLPVWAAGAQGIDQALSRCSPASAFAGGTVVMVQYYDFGFDTNFRCPDGHLAAAFPLPDPFGRAGPSGRSISPGGDILAHWLVVPMVTD
ncbi:MAG: hypothetical protein ACKVT1_06960 [Dehalococcoidia bacterium]